MTHVRILAVHNALVTLFRDNRTRFTFLSIALAVSTLACGGGRQHYSVQAVPISTYAGSPAGHGALDGAASEARFWACAGLCFDAQGNLLVADASNQVIRKVNPHTGETSTWVGAFGQLGRTDGYLSDARCGSCWALTPASDGTVYFSDLLRNSIRKVDSNGLVTTILPGGDSPGFSDGIGAEVYFGSPMGLALDEPKGYLYVTDCYNNAIRRVRLATAETTTLVGNPQLTGHQDGSFETSQIFHPRGIVKAAEDVLYVGCDDSVRKLDLVTRQVTTIAGTPGVRGFADGVGSHAKFNAISGLALDGLGHLLITEGGYYDSCGQVLRSLDLATGRVTTLAGTGNDQPSQDGFIYGQWGCADGIGGGVRFNLPWGVAVDGKGNAYIADLGNDAIRKVNLNTREVKTLAGMKNQKGAANGPLAQAGFSTPSGITQDPAGNTFIADQNNHLIRKISPQGIVSTIAGKAGVEGCDDGPGVLATFKFPADLTVDAQGNLFVADTGNHCIRKIAPDGAVTLFAGLVGTDGGWEDGPRLSAQFAAPHGITMGADGNLYVSDSWNNMIRRIAPDGIVSTFAGSLEQGLVDGVGTAAAFSSPSGIVDDQHGRLIVTDTANRAVRSIDVATGGVTTLAGGTRGSEDGEGRAATFGTPYRIAVHPDGFLLVADFANNAIRKITYSGTVTTVVGTLKDGRPSLSGIKLGSLPGQITEPLGLTFTSDGSLLVLSDCCVLRIIGIR